MSCSLSIALLCLDLAGFYVDGALSTDDSGVEIYEHERTLVTREDIFGRVNYVGDSWSHAYSHESLNPYGRVAIGYEQTFFVPELRLWAELFHKSSLATGRDRGVNGVGIGLRWYPFGGAR